MQIATGFYVGTGLPQQVVTGLSGRLLQFRTAEIGTEELYKSGDMPGGTYQGANGGQPFPGDSITFVGADVLLTSGVGGSGVEPNFSGNTYYWTAWSE